jgi:hypothetical protein
MDYRFVMDYPAKTGVKSAQSGNPSRCLALVRFMGWVVFCGFG